MLRLLPFILIPILIFGGLLFWRYSSSKQSLTTPQQTEEQNQAPIEVPKTLPEATLEDKVKALEEAVSSIVKKINSPAPSVSNGSDSRLTNVEGTITELKARVSSLEKNSPAPPSTGSKYPLYIPLGSSGGPWGNQDWNTVNEYEASINPDNYSGYSGMQLEVNFRLIEAAGTGYARLFNVSDNASVASEVSTTSTAYGLHTSSTFKLPSGTKTYRLQVKTSQGKDLYVQSARIKVSF